MKAIVPSSLCGFNSALLPRSKDSASELDFEAQNTEMFNLGIDSGHRLSRTGRGRAEPEGVPVRIMSPTTRQTAFAPM
jgi:hypothetical protein